MIYCWEGHILNNKITNWLVSKPTLSTRRLVLRVGAKSSNPWPFKECIEPGNHWATRKMGKHKHKHIDHNNYENKYKNMHKLKRTLLQLLPLFHLLYRPENLFSWSLPLRMSSTPHPPPSRSCFPTILPTKPSTTCLDGKQPIRKSRWEGGKSQIRATNGNVDWPAWGPPPNC